MAEAETKAELGTVEQALEALLTGVGPLESETLALEQSGGRVLARDQIARLDVPAFDNSAMDGYALNAVDAGQWLAVSQRVAAGRAPEPLMPGTCARIFTGAPMPPGADCVVMQERVERDGEQALIPAEIASGDSVRGRGRDVCRDAVLLDAGTRLDAAALGHLAGQGVVEVEVRRRPRVALLSTGDEVIDPGTPLAAGQLYNTNRPMLTELLQRFGAEVISRVSVPDDFAHTQAIIQQAAEDADVVISTGGSAWAKKTTSRPRWKPSGSWTYGALPFVRASRWRWGVYLKRGVCPAVTVTCALSDYRATRCRALLAPGCFCAR